MKVTAITRYHLSRGRAGRVLKQWAAEGYVELTEKIQRDLWWRRDEYADRRRIADVRIPPGGRGVWVRIEEVPPDVLEEAAYRERAAAQARWFMRPLLEAQA